MNRKYINILFFMICFTLIFNNIPKPVQANFLGGPVGGKLVFYPLFAGMLYTAWCEWKHKSVLLYKELFFKYLGIYVGVTFLSLVVGLSVYPYYDDILRGPIEQIEKLPKVLTFLNQFGIGIEAKSLLPVWMVARMVKGFFIETLYTFGGAYMIYCWYRDSWKEAFKILVYAIYGSLAVLFIYSIFIEVPYLAGNSAYGKILSLINPYFHSIKDDGKWWPPLLWKGQLRSVFAEPSYFGIYTAFAIPLLWYKIIKERHIIWPVIATVMLFLLFLTKARTGFVLHLGELVLIACIVVLFMRERYYLIKLVMVVMCSLLAFGSSNLFMTYCMNGNKHFANTSQITAAKKYIDSNAGSLANPNKRSNKARYTIMEADFRIGLDHPVLGVGRGLRNGYIPQYLPEKGKQNAEVRMWLAFREKLGLMKSGFPMLGEYTVRFGETGILGLGVFLIPAFVLVFSVIKKLKNVSSNDRPEYLAILISLLGVMAAGVGDTLNITYCYWVLLGLGFAMCFRKEDSADKDLNERT